MRGIPDDPSRRRLIVVLDETGYERLDYDDAASALARRQEIAIMKWPADVDDALATRLQRQGVASPGSVLIQSPYRHDEYVAEANAPDAFALEKAAIFVRLCQLLGAKKVSVEVLEDERNRRKTRTTAQAGKGPVKVSGELELESFDNVASNISWIDTYEGCEPDALRASALLRAHNLDHDPTLRSLVEACEDGSNRQKTRTLTIDLSRDSNQLLKIAAGLEIPTVLSAGGRFERESVSKSRYRATYNVSF